MQPVELGFDPKFEGFDQHSCVSLAPTFMHLRWFLPKTTALVTPLAPLSRYYILVTGSFTESRLRGRVGFCSSWKPCRQGSAPLLSLHSAISVRGILCLSSFHSPSPYDGNSDFSILFFSPFSVYSSSSNPSSCFYLALLFILCLWGFIICDPLWNISFIVDEACKLWGRRIRGPYSNPLLSS